MATWCGARLTGGRAPPAGAGWSKTPAARSASRIELTERGIGSIEPKG
jgi:hypothetical protein